MDIGAMSVREIKDEMFEYIDSRLEKNGFAQVAIQMKNARSLLVEAAKVCVGVREKTGKNDGPLVELIQETIGRADGEAWCMSFVQTLIAYVEKKLNMISPVEPSEHCLTVWNKTEKKHRVSYIPAPGAIAIWRYGKTTKGHTGIVVIWEKGDVIEMIEGNTNSGMSITDDIIRDGGGVYRTRRPKKSSKSMQLLGFIKPF